MWSAGADVARRLVAVSVVALIAGCGGEPASDPNAPPTAEQVARGEEVYREVCSECHSLQPPPNLAPPLSHVGRMLRAEMEDREAFTRHIVTFVRTPSEERSLLPAQAIRRFGLMPAQPVPENQLEDAAAYVWVMADSAQGGMQHGEGMRGGMGRGMASDSTAADTIAPDDTIR